MTSSFEFFLGQL